MGMEIRSRSSSPAVAEGAITAATQGGAGGGHGGDDRASTMSNNNVTPFPGRKRPTQEQVAAQERERAEHGAREEDKRRLKKQLEQNQPLKAADQISVAQNLNGLFVRLKKEHGLGSSKILGTRDKNKRDYAIPRDLPREEIQRLSGRLRNHTDPYKSIVELAAKAMEEVGLKVDVGDFFLEVFGQVDFGSTSSDEPDDGFEELASSLRFVADAISENYGLSAFFRTVEHAGVAPSVVHMTGRKKIKIKFTSDNKDVDGIPPKWFLGWPIELRQFTWVYDSELRGDLPAYPMVIFGAWKVGSSFPVSVRGRRKPAEGWPAVVLSFCIVPTGKERSATPALRIDLCIFAEGAFFDWGQGKKSRSTTTKSTSGPCQTFPHLSPLAISSAMHSRAIGRVAIYFSYR